MARCETCYHAVNGKPGYYILPHNLEWPCRYCIHQFQDYYKDKNMPGGEE